MMTNPHKPSSPNVFIGDQVSRVFPTRARARAWIPACAGMTTNSGGRLLKIFLTACVIFSAAGFLFAAEMSGGTKRITRSSPNQGGSGAEPMSSNSFKVRGTVGEASQGTASGGTRRISDGLMKIYFYPRTITDVTPTPGSSAGSINLTWTAPEDGHNASPLISPSKYVVKYSTYLSPGAIGSQDFFENTATLYALMDPTVGPNSAQSLTLTGLEPGTSYYIAIEARDADKNQSYLSNSTFTWAQDLIMAVMIENLDNINPAEYGFGELSMSTAVVSTATIRVVNAGTVPSDWSLRAATITANSPWQLTTAPVDIDTLRMSAGFDEVQPSIGSFSSTSGTEDMLMPTDTAASATTFSIDGSTTGVDVPIGESRRVWFLLETPLATSTTEQQSIRVTVTANP